MFGSFPGEENSSAKAGNKPVSFDTHIGEWASANGNPSHCMI